MKIIITGAADGLGRELAKKLEGNDLILLDYCEDKLKEVANENNCDYYVCDLTSAEQVEKVCKEITDKNEKIDVLINCAGAWVNEQAELNLNKLRNMILVNVFGTIGMTMSLLPKFKEQKSGLVININSQAGVEREEGFPVYGATKSAIVAFRKNIKRQLGNNNIKITDIHPGMIQTKLFEKDGVKYPDQAFKAYSLSKETIANAILFVINQPSEVVIPSLEIKNVHENL